MGEIQSLNINHSAILSPGICYFCSTMQPRTIASQVYAIDDHFFNCSLMSIVFHAHMQLCSVFQIRCQPSFVISFFFFISQREIPSSNIDLHSVHCARNLQKCQHCGEMVPRKLMDEHYDESHAPVGLQPSQV